MSLDLMSLHELKPNIAGAIHVFVYLLVLIQQIRREMIDGQKGSYTISTLVKSQDEVNSIVEFVVMFRYLRLN